MAPIILHYWDIRGLAQPIRLLLAHSGLEWEDKLYSCGPPPTFDKSCWFDIKPSLGLHFPNLPYLEDGGLKLTQTTAILRYVSRKSGLGPRTEGEHQAVDLIEGEWKDFCGPFVNLCYNKDFTSIKDDYLEGVKGKLRAFSKFLDTSPYFAGERVTWVDFCMYEMFDEHKVMKPDILKEWPNLEDFCARIEGLRGVAEFMASPQFIKYPLNNKMASFGG